MMTHGEPMCAKHHNSGIVGAAVYIIRKDTAHALARGAVCPVGNCGNRVNAGTEHTRT